ncbi:hypothetical protein [Streptomyces sp. NPDC101455]|uniref:hypothetical protein n=1 Tax=Streptomyces sp. NPDC101455 TaxID=3366142 RepID=UPI00382C6E13
MANPRPEPVFPAVYTAAAADLADPRFAGAVLAGVARALDHARIATVYAGHQAQSAADEARWENERPAEVSRRTWLRRMRQKRDTQAG